MMHITWKDVVASLASRGEGLPSPAPGLHDRVLHRLSLEGLVADATASLRGAPQRPDTRASVDVPIAASGPDATLD